MKVIVNLPTVVVAPFVVVTRKHRERDPLPIQHRVELQISVQQVAKWAGCTKRQVDRYELDQDGDAAEELAEVYKSIGELHATVHRVRKQVVT